MLRTALNQLACNIYDSTLLVRNIYAPYVTFLIWETKTRNHSLLL